MEPFIKILVPVVLFLADIRVDWNDFKKAITVSTTGKTIVTENPRTTKAQHLQNFLTSVPFQATGRMEQIISKYTDRKRNRTRTYNI
jgi:hypothetical protein